MLIDTHAHIYLSQFDEDRAESIDRAKALGIDMILMPNIDSSTFDAMNQVRRSYPENCRSMAGLHPCSVKENYLEELERVEKELRTGEYIAVGEIGTDLYWDDSFWKEQKIAFNEQLRMAEEHGLPVVIHCRETLDQTIDMVESYPGDITGVFHCFTGNRDQLDRIRALGFYAGIGGVSTFKNSGMKECLEGAGLDQLVLETDSPYLAPVPNRGKRNEPSYVHAIALNLADITGKSMKEVSDITTENAKTLFKLK